ncbi:MAG TPA: hypothetical protein IAB56_02580 [Candidatus Scybalousia intestinigallinarum]|nr:hypothetical protein [Candidatus Scybalousia intestinigallinarum]
MKVFLVSGRARHGKDTMSRMIAEKYEQMGKKVCFIQLMRPLKEYLKDYFGWDGSEETKPREALQQMGTELIREEMHKPFFFIDRLTEDIEILSHFFDVFMVTDVRLPLEIEELKKRFPGAVSINITREGYENDLSFEEKQHYTEVALIGYHAFDYEVLNTSLEDLKRQVERIVDCEGKKDENND